LTQEQSFSFWVKAVSVANKIKRDFSPPCTVKNKTAAVVARTLPSKLKYVSSVIGFIDLT